MAHSCSIRGANREEEMKEVGQWQGGQTEQPQQGCYSCQTVPTKLGQMEGLEAQYNACKMMLHSEVL